MQIQLIGFSGSLRQSWLVSSDLFKVCPEKPSFIMRLSFSVFITDYHFSIMEGEESLKVYSPEIKIQDPCVKSAIPHFPPVYLVHGTADYSIPSVARLVYELKFTGYYILFIKKLVIIYFFSVQGNF